MSVSNIRERINRLRELEVALFNRQAAESERISTKQVQYYELQQMIAQAQKNPLYLAYLSQQLGRAITYDDLIRRLREIERELRTAMMEYDRLANERKKIAEEIYRLQQLLVQKTTTPVVYAESPEELPVEVRNMLRELTLLRREAQRPDIPIQAYNQYLQRIREIQRRLRELGYEY
jgi:chromosome segregation ATPase